MICALNFRMEEVNVYDLVKNATCNFITNLV